MGTSVAWLAARIGSGRLVPAAAGWPAAAAGICASPGTSAIICCGGGTWLVPWGRVACHPLVGWVVCWLSGRRGQGSGQRVLQLMIEMVEAWRSPRDDRGGDWQTMGPPFLMEGEKQCWSQLCRLFYLYVGVAVQDQSLFIDSLGKVRAERQRGEQRALQRKGRSMSKKQGTSSRCNGRLSGRAAQAARPS